MAQGQRVIWNICKQVKARKATLQQAGSNEISVPEVLN